MKTTLDAVINSLSSGLPEEGARLPDSGCGQGADPLQDRTLRPDDRVAQHIRLKLPEILKMQEEAQLIAAGPELRPEATQIINRAAEMAGRLVEMKKNAAEHCRALDAIQDLRTAKYAILRERAARALAGTRDPEALMALCECGLADTSPEIRAESAQALQGTENRQALDWLVDKINNSHAHDSELVTGCIRALKHTQDEHAIKTVCDWLNYSYDCLADRKPIEYGVEAISGTKHPAALMLLYRDLHNVYYRDMCFPRALQSIGDPEDLLSMAKQFELEGRTQNLLKAIYALKGTTYIKAVDWLIAQLNREKDREVRVAALKSLSGNKDKAVVKALTSILLDFDEVPHLCLEAVAGLKGVRDIEAEEELILRLQRVNEVHGRRALIEEISGKEHPAAVDALGYGSGANTADTSMHRAACQALRGSENAGALEFLSNCVLRDSGIRGEEAACALQGTGNRRALDVVIQGLEGCPDPIIRENCAFALSGTSDTAAIDGLFRGLCDPEEQVRETAAESLRECSFRLVGERLAGLSLAEVPVEVRRMAVIALEGREEPEAVETLLRIACEDGAPALREAAALALGRICGADKQKRVCEMALNETAPEVLQALAALLEATQETAVLDWLMETGLKYPAACVRTFSARALKDTTDPPALQALCQRASLEQDRDVMAAIISSIGSRPCPAGIETLYGIARMNFPENVRAQAVDALRCMGDEGIRINLDNSDLVNLVPEGPLKSYIAAVRLAVRKLENLTASTADVNLAGPGGHQSLTLSQWKELVNVGRHRGQEPFVQRQLLDELMNAPETDIRRRAARGLKGARSRDMVEGMVFVLRNDKSPRVRAEVVNSLRHLRDSEIQEAIREAGF